MAEFKEAIQDYEYLQDEYQSNFKLVPRITISENSSEVFCIRFSPDGKHLAAGCGDGSIRVFDASNGNVAFNVERGSNAAFPTACIRFRPVTSSNDVKNIFLSANTAGTVQHWHMTSGKCIHTITNRENEVYALDYNGRGSSFAAAGRDSSIRVYDEATKCIIATLNGSTPGDYSNINPGHASHIFSVKFSHDENLLLSGGWDNTVHIWDIREGRSVRRLHGPHICGDSLDIKGNEILTGSYRHCHQLELWDFGTGERIDEIPWNAGQSHFDYRDRSCNLYAAQFSKDTRGRFIVAGGSGANEAKVFDHGINNALVGTVTGLEKGVFTVDFSPDREKVAIAGGDSCIRVFDLIEKYEI